MSHYDYFSPRTGLSGLESLIDVKKLGAGLDREQAYAVFQFGLDQGKSPEERGRRFREWKVEPAWLAAFEAARLITFVDDKPLAPIAKEDLTVKQRRTVANAVKAQFDKAWAEQISGGGSSSSSSSGGGGAAPSKGRGSFSFDPQTAFLTGRLTAGGGLLPGGAASGASTSAVKPFPIVPVAIGAAVVAILLLRRK